jgi:hypothetical protein
MSFENLETVTKQNMPPMAKISYMPPQGRGKSVAKHNKDPKPQLIVSIPTTVCGTSKAKSFALLLGTGADAGKIRIKGSKTGGAGVEPKELMHAFIFRFGFVPKLGDDHFDGEHRPVRKVSDDEFEIDVPRSWFETADV